MMFRFRLAIVAASTTLLLTPFALRAQRVLRGDDAARVARLLAMRDTRTFDSALVDSSLASRSTFVRSMATLSIGQVHATSAASRLRTLLTDSDTSVSATAAYALGLLRDSASNAALASVLRSQSPAATEAAWALGEIGASARLAIEDGLSDATLSGTARSALLLASAKLRPVPVSRVVPHLSASSERVRWAAAYAIGRTASPGGVRALFGGVADVSADVRMMVASGLAKRAAGDSLADTARSALRRLASDRDARVRVNAYRALASYGELDRAVIVGGLKDRDANVRVAIAQAIATVLDSTRAPWIAVWSADTGFAYRSAVLASAARKGVALDSNDTWLRSPNWRARLASLAAGAASADATVRSRRARALLADQNAQVRAMALSVLLGDTLNADREALRRAALSDTAAAVRLAISESLDRMPASEATSLAVRLYRAALADRENDARLSALRAIAATWKRDSSSIPDSVRALVRDLPRPSDPLERSSVATLSLVNWGSAHGEPQPPAFYEGVVRSVIMPSLAGRPPRAVFRTERGSMTVQLLGAAAPLTVQNFVTLVRRGYYSGTAFHRVVPNFVAQDGDPTGTGEGGPGYAIRDEFNRVRYTRGTVGMALSGPDTGGSQYFFCHSAQPHLDGHYTVFAQLVDGAAVLDRIVQGDRILSITVR